MIRKAIVAVALVAGILGMGASSAFALDCRNVSRPAPAEPSQPVADLSPIGGPVVYVIQGEWWFVSFDGQFADGYWDFVPPGALVNVVGAPAPLVESLGLPAAAVNGNYQSGSGFGLLDKAQAPCNDNRQTAHGIQADSTRCGGGL